METLIFNKGLNIENIVYIAVKENVMFIAKFWKHTARS